MIPHLLEPDTKPSGDSPPATHPRTGSSTAETTQNPHLPLSVSPDPKDASEIQLHLKPHETILQHRHPQISVSTCSLQQHFYRARNVLLQIHHHCLELIMTVQAFLFPCLTSNQNTRHRGSIG